MPVIINEPCSDSSSCCSALSLLEMKLSNSFESSRQKFCSPDSMAFFKFLCHYQRIREIGVSILASSKFHHANEGQCKAIEWTLPPIVHSTTGLAEDEFFDSIELRLLHKQNDLV